MSRLGGKNHFSGGKMRHRGINDLLNLLLQHSNAGLSDSIILPLVFPKCDWGGINEMHLELKILGELKSCRLGRVAKFSLLPVPLAVGGSSDKTSSLHHATHSPFGQTHSGLSNQQRKHGQALRHCGSQLLSQRLCMEAPTSPLPFSGR